MVDQIVMAVLAAGVMLGGADRLLGNRFGLGEQFEKGFLLLGPTALSMAGMICLAPVLAGALEWAAAPLYRLLGVDPAMLGSVLAIDMGGYQLARELAADPRVGSYAGLVVSSMFGCTLVFTIPVGMGMIREEDRGLFAWGIMLGLAAMPVGLGAGGLLCGLGPLDCLRQNIPVFALALVLLLGLWRWPERMVKGFCLLAEGLRAVVTVGLVLAAVEYFTGWNPVPGMAPIGEAMEVAASIGVAMLGSLPAAELLRRLLAAPLTRLGDRLGVGPQGLTGILVGLVTPLPALSMYGEMNRRGKVAAGAFLVSGASLLAAHMGFVVATEPDMLGAVMAGKLSGALAGLVLALAVRTGSGDGGQERADVSCRHILRKSP